MVICKVQFLKIWQFQIPSVNDFQGLKSSSLLYRFRLFKGEEKGKETTVDLTGEEKERDEFLQLMIEKKVLEYEKVKAETELHFWKDSISCKYC